MRSFRDHSDYDFDDHDHDHDGDDREEWCGNPHGCDLDDDDLLDELDRAADRDAAWLLGLCALAFAGLVTWLVWMAAQLLAIA